MKEKEEVEEEEEEEEAEWGSSSSFSGCKDKSCHSAEERVG